tara:strand:- start:304 stop:909 length:606 start_codon:yes stop_codon:yes gene_type:complete
MGTDMQLQEKSKGLWHNIRAKRARGEKPAHKNSKAHKDAVKAGEKINAEEGLWANINAKKKRGEKSARKGSKAYKAAVKAGNKLKDSVIYRNEVLRLEIVEHSEPVIFQEAEYQGRTVKLNKPTRGDTKKFKVYVNTGKKNADGTIKVKKVNFGHGGTSAKRKTMRIRKSNPKARASFRATHNCDNPGPKTKARYWSCRKW